MLLISPLTIVEADGVQATSAGFTGLQMMQGDDPRWAAQDYDSSDWPVSTTVGGGFNKIQKPATIGWLRSQPFSLPSNFTERPMALYLITGASFEVYWNGVKIGESGKPAALENNEIVGPVDTRFYIPPEYIQAEGNVLAIRYSAHGYKKWHLPLAVAVNIGLYQNENYARLVGHVPGFLLIGAVGGAALYFGALFFLSLIHI